MIVYAESSGVLAWLLGETLGGPVQEVLATAGSVVASRLTVAECERALVRLAESGTLKATGAAKLRRVLARAQTAWFQLDIGDAVLARVGTAFPREPIRTLDAIHLSSILECRAGEPGLTVLSLDQRIRDNAERLGIPVVP